MFIVGSASDKNNVSRMRINQGSCYSRILVGATIVRVSALTGKAVVKHEPIIKRSISGITIIFVMLNPTLTFPLGIYAFLSRFLDQAA